MRSFTAMQHLQGIPGIRLALHKSRGDYNSSRFRHGKLSGGPLYCPVVSTFLFSLGSKDKHASKVGTNAERRPLRQHSYGHGNGSDNNGACCKASATVQPEAAGKHSSATLPQHNLSSPSAMQLKDRPEAHNVSQDDETREWADSRIRAVASWPRFVRLTTLSVRRRIRWGIFGRRMYLRGGSGSGSGGGSGDDSAGNALQLPPETSILAAACVVGLLTGFSVVLFNDTVRERERERSGQERENACLLWCMQLRWPRCLWLAHAKLQGYKPHAPWAKILGLCFMHDIPHWR